ncbi:MAG: winged helix-turn-helix transcriptional regulator [Xanthobacteraceae bacterium]
MVEATRGEEAERARVVLGLLESVERNGAQSQRHLASELGIALGLVNAYLKRCVKKGLVKVRQAPARRYAYYLTPRGFAEKSRLTVEYLAVSFSFFRQARSDCVEALVAAKSKNLGRLALAGTSDLAEIACICALEHKIQLAAVVDLQTQASTFIGLPIMPSFDALPEAVEGVLITDLRTAQETYDAAVQRFGAERVFAPALLGVVPRINGEMRP